MRLSEAVLLGSTILHPMPEVIHQVRQINGENVESGCAIGMALKATCDFLRSADSLWPWLGRIEQPPCGCYGNRNTVQFIITHIFDFHIFVCADWNLERLIEWIRSIEPTEATAAVFAPESAERQTEEILSGH